MLCRRHQDYIYNVSLKLFLDPDDALDATQEVLIKVITRLKTFENKSGFRTWLYRIAFNHFLNSPQRKMERLFERNFDFSQIPANDPPADEPDEATVEEVRVACLTAMLMCLNREQRLIYIVGEVFCADHQTGAELFEISPANFRVKLHRARRNLLNYVTKKCGLIDPNNACRCHKKTRQMIAAGMVDPAKKRFKANFERKINELVLQQKAEICTRVEIDMAELFRDSPFQICDELDLMLSEIVSPPV